MSTAERDSIDSTRNSKRDTQALAAAFSDHERLLWGMCYRMTGCAADADDLVQETFARALERPPERTDMPWRPWLVRVAMNLGRDALRRRRRRGYVGPWLPSPIEELAVADEANELASPAQSSEARYDLLESTSFAFLLALEALTPTQRAVLLLRDVYDYSVRETADALGLSEANVKTTLHRAHRAMASYEQERVPPGPEAQARTRAALEALLACMARQDLASLEALLVADVRALSDGGGEFVAGRVPVIGQNRVARLYCKLAQRVGVARRVDIRLINGLPALVVELGPEASPAGASRPRRPWAPRYVLRCELGRDGRIREIHTILATRKLTSIAR